MVWGGRGGSRNGRASIRARILSNALVVMVLLRLPRQSGLVVLVGRELAAAAAAV